MLRVTHPLAVSLALAALGVPSLAVTLAACSSGDEATIEPDELDNEAKADGVTYPVGTYGLSKPSAPDAPDFVTLVLLSDKSFYAERGGFCGPACNAPITGTYKFTKSTTTTKKYLRFTLDDGTLLGRWVWTLSKGVLKLTPDGTKLTQQMTLAAEAWCGGAGDCELQNLTTVGCDGDWSGDDAVCSFVCATGSNACEDAGGDCVGLSPSSCQDGHVGDAHDYSCGGGLGVECCLPNTNACEDAGGRCVGLSPTSCKDGRVGDANSYSCGGGLGVECCLPKPKPPTCQPTIGGAHAWYGADGGRVCLADCTGATVKCGAVGSKSEGWYTSSGHGCGGGTLITWADCQ